MNEISKDLITGLAFMAGLLGFVSGEYIISSTLFAAAAVASIVSINNKIEKNKV